ncbi:hypothetical protein ES708_31011 [subsurface metagenome]
MAFTAKRRQSSCAPRGGGQPLAAGARWFLFGLYGQAAAERVCAPGGRPAGAIFFSKHHAGKSTLPTLALGKQSPCQAGAPTSELDRDRWTACDRRPLAGPPTAGPLTAPWIAGWDRPATGRIGDRIPDRTHKPTVQCTAGLMN